MTSRVSDTLLAALGIAAFARGADGSFSSVTPPPAWFGRLVADPTFPFLGHILEDANAFWNSATPGFQEFGPCAEVDQSGREFHYKVIAVTSVDGQFLLFQPDPAADRLREILQKARERLLHGSSDQPAHAIASILQTEAMAAADEIRELVGRLHRHRPSGDTVLLEAIAARCDRLRACVESTQT